MVLCSMSPGDATCSLSSSVTARPAAPGWAADRPGGSGARAEPSAALMYPQLMFNESCIFRQVQAGIEKKQPENGFIVLL